MKINWKQFFKTFFVVYSMMLIATFCVGCTASWIGVVTGLLPAIEAAVSAIVAFVENLQGKTVPPSVTAAIQKITADIQTELQNVSTLITQVQSGGSTVIAQIGAALNGVLSNLGSILSGLSITDSSTIQKITELVGLAVAAVQAVLAIVPLAQAKLAESPSEAHLEAFDKATASNMKNTHKALQEGYKVVVTTPTESMDVNEALAALPQNLP